MSASSKKIYWLIILQGLIVTFIADIAVRALNFLWLRHLYAIDTWYLYDSGFRWEYYGVYALSIVVSLLPPLAGLLTAAYLYGKKNKPAANDIEISNIK